MFMKERVKVSIQLFKSDYLENHTNISPIGRRNVLK